MTGQKPSQFAAVMGTARGKLISALVVVALLLGIVAEGISIVTSYYTMQKTRAEAEASTAKFHNPFSGH